MLNTVMRSFGAMRTNGFDRLDSMVLLTGKNDVHMRCSSTTVLKTLIADRRRFDIV